MRLAVFEESEKENRRKDCDSKEGRQRPPGHCPEHVFHIGTKYETEQLTYNVKSKLKLLCYSTIVK